MEIAFFLGLIAFCGACTLPLPDTGTDFLDLFLSFFGFFKVSPKYFYKVHFAQNVFSKQVLCNFYSLLYL